MVGQKNQCLSPGCEDSTKHVNHLTICFPRWLVSVMSITPGSSYLANNFLKQKVILIIPPGEIDKMQKENDAHTV